jgi:hypothetical protein
MARSATAAPDIERRLGQWLTARDGLLYVHEPPDVHVLPQLVSDWTPTHANSPGAEPGALYVFRSRRFDKKTAFRWLSRSSDIR